MNPPDLDFWRVLNALTLLKARNPEQRVGQILFNAFGDDLFYLADDVVADFLEAIVRGEQ